MNGFQVNNTILVAIILLICSLAVTLVGN